MKVVVSPGTMKAESFPTGRYRLGGEGGGVGGTGSSSLMEVAAAAAAKSRQLYPTLCNPIDGSPSGSSVPGILQARTLEWVAISFSSA